MAMQITPTTFGASVFNGDINIGTNKLTTGNVCIMQDDVNGFKIRNATDTFYKNFVVGDFFSTGKFTIFSDAGLLVAGTGADNGYVSIKAKDNGVGPVEVARFQGAADPYFLAGPYAYFYQGGTITFQNKLWFAGSIDSASVPDYVNIGPYDLAADRRTLALSTEEAVAAGIAVASTHTLSVRINGETYKILLSNI
jgi:hypothetical protein